MAAYFDQPELPRSSWLGKSRITTKACGQLLLLLSIVLSMPTYAAEKSSTSENVALTDEVANNNAVNNEPSAQPTTAPTVNNPAINNPATSDLNNGPNSNITITPEIPNTSDTAPPTPVELPPVISGESTNNVKIETTPTP